MQEPYMQNNVSCTMGYKNIQIKHNTSIFSTYKSAREIPLCLLFEYNRWL